MARGCLAPGRSGGDTSHEGPSSAIGCKEWHDPHDRGSGVLLLDAGKEAPSFTMLLVSPPATAPRIRHGFQGAMALCFEKMATRAPPFRLSMPECLENHGLHPRNLLCHVSREKGRHSPVGETSHLLFHPRLNFPQNQMQA
jgi:hypothetical protein